MSGNNINNEEYNFPNREDKDKYSMSPIGGTESLKSLLKNTRLMKSMGFVVLFYIIVQVATYYIADKETEQSNVPEIVVEEINNIPEPPEPPAPEIVKVENNNVDNQLQNQQLKKLSADVSDQEINISRFNSRLREIENMQQNLVYKLNNLDKQFQSSMSHITTYVNEQKKIAEEKKQLELKQKLEKQRQKKAKNNLIFYTRAAINGRAWLYDKNNNRDVTVKVGDRLKTYGVITKIDADSGVVNTSSGRVIEFSPFDN